MQEILFPNFHFEYKMSKNSLITLFLLQYKSQKKLYILVFLEKKISKEFILIFFNPKI